MAWIYLAESVESPKLWLHGCELSPIVKEVDLARAFCFLECVEEKSNQLQSGMTLSLFEDHDYHQLTSSPEAFLVRTLAVQAFKKAWVESGLDFSSKFLGLPKKLKHLFFSSKMLKESQNSFQLSELKLKAWDTNAEMDLSKPLTLELDTKEIDGSYLPTPTASRNGSNQGGAAGRQGKVRYSIDSLWRMGTIPTPLASEAKGSSGENRDSPRVSNYWKWTIGTKLPASFVEILMGYKIGSTVSEPWVIQWFRSKQEKRSKY